MDELKATDADDQTVVPDENHLIAERRAKLERLRERGTAFPNDFRRDATAGDLHVGIRRPRAGMARRARRRA